MSKEREDPVQAVLVQAARMRADLFQFVFEKVAFEQAASVPVLSVRENLAEVQSVRRRDRTRTKPATGTKKQSCPLR